MVAVVVAVAVVGAVVAAAVQSRLTGALWITSPKMRCEGRRRPLRCRHETRAGSNGKLSGMQRVHPWVPEWATAAAEWASAVDRRQAACLALVAVWGLLCPALPVVATAATATACYLGALGVRLCPVGGECEDAHNNTNNNNSRDRVL